MAFYKMRYLVQIEKAKRAVQYIVSDSLFNSPPLKLLRSWLFQGKLYMDAGEKIFNFVIELLLITIIVFILRTLSISNSVFWGIVSIHTAMWLLNGHFWALEIRKGRRMAINEPLRVFEYLQSLKLRVDNSAYIDGCVIFGSLARGLFKESSDLDLVFVPSNGVMASSFAYAIAMRERLIAFILRSPIELYVYNKNFLSMTADKERPILVKDHTGHLGKHIPEAVNFSANTINSQPFFRSLIERN